MRLDFLISLCCFVFAFMFVAIFVVDDDFVCVAAVVALGFVCFHNSYS